MKKWQCQVCGYIHEGPEPPDKCPVCGADKKLFEEAGGEEKPETDTKETQKTESASFPDKKWRCTVCGYIHTGPEPPEKCPVCGADKKLFEEAGGEEKPAAGSNETEQAESAPSIDKKWRCTVCGYIHTGPEPPDKCPVCGADKSLFEEVADEAAPKPEQAPPEPKAAEPEKPKAAPSKQEAPQKATSSGAVKKWRCTVCGYIHEGPEPPEKCPVCGADKSLFVEITEGTDAGAQTGGIDLGPVPEDLPGRLYHLAIGQILKHHAHPVSVHIPNGVIPFSFIFILLASLSGCHALEIAAKCNMIFVVLALPLVLFTGYIEWQKRYKGALTDRFIIKILCAAIVAVLAVCVVIWWLINPEVLSPDSGSRWVFILTNAIMLGAAGVAGLIGGKFVFKD